LSEFREILTKAFLLSAATVALAAYVGGCSDPGQDVKHYVLTGTVVEVDKADQALVVNMDAIPGYMEAMSMSSHVKDAADLAPIKPGDAIRGDLVVHANGSWLQHVAVTSKAK